MRTVYPQSGFTEDDVHAVLARRQFVYADTFTITPLAGDPLRYTNYQKNLTLIPVGDSVSQTFLAKSLNVEGLRMKASVGIDADEQEISLNYPVDETGYQGLLSWPQALLRGRLDGATIKRDRYVRDDFSSNWAGGWTMFKGRVAGIDSVGRSSAQVKVKSDLILLDTQMPRDMYEPNCNNTWGDANCGVDQELFAVSGAVEEGSTHSTLIWSSSSTSYALGKVLIDNGDDIVRVRTISRADATHLYLAYPLDFIPSVGMSFTAYPGCNRTSDRCLFFHGDPTWKTRFNGFPFIPVAEAAVGIGVGGQESKGGK